MNEEVISTRLYFELLKRQDNLTVEEQKEMLNYSNFIVRLFRYNDYLLPNVKKVLDEYKQEIYKLLILNEEHPELLNEFQRDEFNRYQNMMNILNENFKVRALTKDSEFSGFANALMIAGTIIVAGILFGASLFFFL